MGRHSKKSTANDMMGYLNHLGQECVRLANDLDSNKIRQEYTRIASKQVQKDVDYIINSCVEQWYSEYTPHSYKRKLTLFKAHRVTFDGNRVWIEWNSDYIPEVHRAESEYIYKISYRLGYHGGADKISPQKAAKYGEYGPHPNPGVPYWRTSIKGGPPFTMWYPTPATKSKSPLECAKLELIKYQNVKGSSMIMAMLGHKLQDVADMAWKQVISQYDIQLKGW